MLLGVAVNLDVVLTLVHPSFAQARSNLNFEDVVLELWQVPAVEIIVDVELLRGCEASSIDRKLRI